MAGEDVVWLCRCFLRQAWTTDRRDYFHGQWRFVACLNDCGTGQLEILLSTTKRVMRDE